MIWTAFKLHRIINLTKQCKTIVVHYANVCNTSNHKVHEEKLQTTRQLHNFFGFIKHCDKFNQQQKQKWLEIKNNVRSKKLRKQHHYCLDTRVQ